MCLLLQFDASWSRGDKLALLGLLAAIASLAAAIWPYVRQRLLERRISRDFGVDLYQPGVIHQATKYYIVPDASSVDLTQEMEDRTNRVPTREDLFRAVNRFLDDDSVHRHMLLLADSGMGKSAFVLSFYAHNKRWMRRNAYRISVIPLGHAKAIEKIGQIENKRDTVIFLDAFDEDPTAKEDYWNRLKMILLECSEFKRVLITCRTQFFPKDDAIPTSTGMIRVEPRVGDGRLDFWRLYIAPFSNRQVDKYLRRRFRFKWWKRNAARKLIFKIPLLAIRPMLLANVPDIIAKPIDLQYSWELYEIMVRAWYRREQGWWPDVERIQSFSEEVAVKLYVNYANNKSNTIPRQELTEFIRGLTVPIEEWNATTRSLLHRDAEGNFKFAHRSIMEYLFAKRFIAGDARCRDIELTDQIQTFLWEMCESRMGKVGSSVLQVPKLESLFFGSQGCRFLISRARHHPSSIKLLTYLLGLMIDSKRTGDTRISLFKCARPPLITQDARSRGKDPDEVFLRAKFEMIGVYPRGYRPSITGDILIVPVTTKIFGTNDVDFSQLPRAVQHSINPKTRSLILAPIFPAVDTHPERPRPQELVGVLMAESNYKNAFSEELLSTLEELLQLIAPQVRSQNNLSI